MNITINNIKRYKAIAKMHGKSPTSEHNIDLKESQKANNCLNVVVFFLLHTFKFKRKNKYILSKRLSFAFYTQQANSVQNVTIDLEFNQINQSDFIGTLFM